MVQCRSLRHCTMRAAACAFAHPLAGSWSQNATGENDTRAYTARTPENSAASWATGYRPSLWQPICSTILLGEPESRTGGMESSRKGPCGVR
jgi:hypothetical protein